MLNDWKQSINIDKMVGTISVNLNKSFDILPHGLLIVKPFTYGVDFNP